MPIGDASEKAYSARTHWRQSAGQHNGAGHFVGEILICGHKIKDILP